MPSVTLLEAYPGGASQSSHLARSVVTDIIKNVGKAKRDASDITEQPPIYNVWNVSVCDPRFGAGFTSQDMRLKDKRFYAWVQHHRSGRPGSTPGVTGLEAYPGETHKGDC